MTEDITMRTFSWPVVQDADVELILALTAILDWHRANLNTTQAGRLAALNWALDAEKRKLEAVA